MSDSVHFKLSHNGKTKRFALIRTDDPLRIEELFLSVRQRVATIVGSPPGNIELAWKDVNSAAISPPSIPLITPQDLQRAIEFIMHFDGQDEQAKNRPLCLHLDVIISSQEEEFIPHCFLCSSRLHSSSSHLQCPYKSSHTFCLDCTKTNLWQQHTKKEMNCPSGEKCLITGTIKSWSFTEEMLQECLGSTSVEFMEKRNAARTAFVFAVAADVGKRLRAKAARYSSQKEETEEGCDENENESALSMMRRRENVVPGSAVRDIVEETEERLQGSPIDDIDESNANPVKKEELNTAPNEGRSAKSFDSIDEKEAKSGPTKTIMSELKAEQVFDDPLGCSLAVDEDTPTPLEAPVKAQTITEKEEVKIIPTLKTNGAAKPRKTVAQKIAAVKSIPAQNDEAEDELKEEMRDFMKTAATDAVDAVVEARSVLMEAAKSGFKELFKPIQTETLALAKDSEEGKENIKTDKPSVNSPAVKKNACGNKCEGCNELKKRVRALEKELMEKKILKSEFPQDLPLCYRELEASREKEIEHSMESNTEEHETRFEEYCNELLGMCRYTEQELHKLYLFLPTNLHDSMRMSLELEQYANNFEKRINDSSIVWKLTLNEAFDSTTIDGEYLLQLEEEVTKSIQKLSELFTKRKESLKVITEFYEFHEQFEIVPLLQNMEM